MLRGTTRKYLDSLYKMDANKVVPQRGTSGCGLEQQINVPKTAAPEEPDIHRTSGPEISSHQAEWPDGCHGEDQGDRPFRRLPRACVNQGLDC